MVIQFGQHLQIIMSKESVGFLFSKISIDCRTRCIARMWSSVHRRCGFAFDCMCNCVSCICHISVDPFSCLLPLRAVHHWSPLLRISRELFSFHRWPFLPVSFLPILLPQSCPKCSCCVALDFLDLWDWPHAIEHDSCSACQCCGIQRKCILQALRPVRQRSSILLAFHHPQISPVATAHGTSSAPHRWLCWTTIHSSYCRYHCHCCCCWWLGYCWHSSIDRGPTTHSCATEY